MRRSLLAACVMLIALASAQAQTYPSRPIRMIVPFPPGGPTDSMARLVAQRLSLRLGQSVIVESRPGGAGGTVGAKAVAGSEPDGYTLLLALTGTLTISPAIYRDSGYDPTRSFVAVASIATSGQVLAINPTVPANTLPELVAYAQANPGKLSYASPGYGTQPHLLGELLNSTAANSLVHVPYKGSAPAVTDLLAGQVQIMFDAPTIMLPQVEAGRLRALAVTGDKRMGRLSQVPTVAEAGFPKLQATLWAGVVAPARTPASIVALLNNAINEDLNTEQMRADLAKFGTEPQIQSPEQFSAFLAEEARRWAEVVHAAGIKGE